MQSFRIAVLGFARVVIPIVALFFVLAVFVSPAYAVEANEQASEDIGQQTAAVLADEFAVDNAQAVAAQDTQDKGTQVDGSETQDANVDVDTEVVGASDEVEGNTEDNEDADADAQTTDTDAKQTTDRPAADVDADVVIAVEGDKIDVEQPDGRDGHTCVVPGECDKEKLVDNNNIASAASSVQVSSGTNAKTVQVASGVWDALSLEMKASGNTLGSLIELSPKMTGSTSDLAFRYIIETANGSDVTVMRRYKRGVPDYSFKLNRSGNVTIKLIVSDYQGKTKELKRTLSVPTPAWELDGITADYQDSGDTVFVPGLTGDTSYLRYTYTWTAVDGSKRTGTLKPNGTVSEAWKPAAGTYDLALRVVGTDGKQRTAALTYIHGSKRASYTYQASDDSAKVGAKVTFQAKGTDEDGTQLKFRYSLVGVDGKAKVFRAASTGPTATLTAPAPGGYFTVHVDALLGNGTTVTRIDPMVIWDFKSITASKNGRTVTATANMMALPSGFTYRFTRSGSTGGVLFAQGKNNVGTFKAPADGTYEISCAVFDKNGKQVGIRTTTVKVVPAPVEVLDNRAQSFSSATNKLILVDTYNKYVSIYQGSQGNWTNIHFNRVSVGKPSSPTIKGSYTVGGKGYSFSGSSYTCYYWTQISGAYLFHSVKYKLGSNVISDGRLGKEISAGCVRMDINDAKWLQNNVPSGSRIYIY